MTINMQPIVPVHISWFVYSLKLSLTSSPFTSTSLSLSLSHPIKREQRRRSQIVERSSIILYLWSLYHIYQSLSASLIHPSPAFFYPPALWFSLSSMLFNSLVMVSEKALEHTETPHYNHCCTGSHDNTDNYLIVNYILVLASDSVDVPYSAAYMFQWLHRPLWTMQPPLEWPVAICCHNKNAQEPLHHRDDMFNHWIESELPTNWKVTKPVLQGRTYNFMLPSCHSSPF